MLKNILKLDGAQKLSKNEQKSIKGGVTQICASALASGQCYFKPSSGCGAGFATKFGPCNSIAICCEKDF